MSLMITIIKNKDKLDIVHEKIEEKIFLEDLSFNGFFDKFIGNFISRQSLELLKSNGVFFVPPTNPTKDFGY